MRIAKKGFGDAGWMSLLIDKEDTSNLVGDIAEEMIVTTAGAAVAKFTIAVEMTGFFLHEVLR